jgi:hypothetical protein
MASGSGRPLFWLSGKRSVLRARGRSFSVVVSALAAIEASVTAPLSGIAEYLALRP